MEYIPLNDNVIVRLIDEDEKTKSGFYKPKNSSNTFVGTVVAVGPGLHTADGNNMIPTKVSVGDTIIAQNSGIELTLDGEKYNLYREPDLAMYKPKQ